MLHARAAAQWHVVGQITHDSILFCLCLELSLLRACILLLRPLLLLAQIDDLRHARQRMGCAVLCCISWGRPMAALEAAVRGGSEVPTADD